MEKNISVYKELVRRDHLMSVIEFATLDTDYGAVGSSKARLLELMLSHNASLYCLKPIRNSDKDMPCFSCEKHKRRAYLQMSVPITLKMISYLNQALIERANYEDGPTLRYKMISH